MRTVKPSVRAVDDPETVGVAPGVERAANSSGVTSDR